MSAEPGCGCYDCVTTRLYEESIDELTTKSAILSARCESAEQAVREWRRASGAAADAGSALVERVDVLEAALRQSRCSVCGRDWVPNLTDEDDVPPWCEVCGPARAALSPT